MAKKNLIILFIISILFYSLSLVGAYVYGQTSGVSHHPLEIECTGELCVKSNGVGIGTIEPGAKLHVKGTRDSNVSTTTSVAKIGGSDVYLYTNAMNSSPWGVWMQVFNDSGKGFPLVLNPAGSNVGIGTANPSSDWKVDISGSLFASGEIRSGSLFYSPSVKVGPIVADDKYPHLKLEVDPTYQNNGADIKIKTEGVSGQAGRSNLVFEISNWGGTFYWRMGSKDGPVNIMSLSELNGNLSVLGTIKSANKKQLYAHIPISTLDNYHPDCDICPSGTDNGSCALTMMYCTAACHRYCNKEYGYSGGTLVEHNSGKKEADCLCIP